MTKRVRIIAEAGVNHNGRLDLALALVDMAADAGADVVKFQTFMADRIATRAAPKAGYQLRTTDSSESQWEMLKRLELSEASHRLLVERCRMRGIGFLSTPFDEESADFLMSLGVGEFKIPSGEITNLPLVAHIARFGWPIILSTGMADLDEVRVAVDTIRAAGAPSLCLLQCTTEYPAPPGSANLLAMRTMADAFGVPVGLSDHTMGIAVALAAVALGATVIEKHVTLDRTLPGPDHGASLEPSELAALVEGVRTVEAALGDGHKVPSAIEMSNRESIRKSLVAVRDLEAGAVLGDGDIVARRPGTGLPPADRAHVIGRRIRHCISAGTPISKDMLA